MIEAIGALVVVVIIAMGIMTIVSTYATAYRRELRWASLRTENERLRAENERLSVLLADARAAADTALSYPGYAGYPAPHLAAYPSDNAVASDPPIERTRP